MIYDNNERLMQNPLRRAAGLRGLGDDNTASADPAPAWYTDSKLWTAINSESLWVTNLFRGINNQPPLQASQYAPQVAVGLNQDTQNLVVMGGIAVLAFMALRGKKKKRK